VEKRVKANLHGSSLTTAPRERVFFFLFKRIPGYRSCKRTKTDSESNESAAKINVIRSNGRASFRGKLLDILSEKSRKRNYEILFSFENYNYVQYQSVCNNIIISHSAFIRCVLPRRRIKF